MLRRLVAQDLSCNYPQDESYATSPGSAGFILQLPQDESCATLPGSAGFILQLPTG